LLARTGALSPGGFVGIDLDPAWIDEQERRFAEVVGADNYRLVHEGHAVDQYDKISEYR